MTGGEPWNVWGPCTVPPGMQQLIRVTPPNIIEVLGKVLFNNLSSVPMALTLWIVPTGMHADDNMIILGTPMQGLTIPPGDGEPYVAGALEGMVLKAGYSVQMLVTQPVNTVANGWIYRGGMGQQVSEMPVIQPQSQPRQVRSSTFSIVTDPAGISGALKGNP